MADSLALLSAAASPQADRVLVLRLDNIGDFVVWLDAAKEIVEHYRAQGKRVTLLANAVWKSWAEELGVFDEVIALEEKRLRRDLRYRFLEMRRIRSQGFGTVIQPAYTRLLDLGDSLVRLSGATHRLGPEGVFDHGMERNRSLGDRWYSQLFAVDPQLGGEMQRNAALVRALTETPYRARVADLRGTVDSTLPGDLETELHGRSYFVLFPGASYAGRLWPAERYVELAHQIHAMTGWVAVVCGGPSEAGQAALMCEAASVPMLNWVGRTSLRGLTTVLARAELLVGNETSAVHIAAAVGIPAVCLVGGGHFGRFMPYSVEQRDERPLPIAAVHKMDCFGCDWRCVYHPPKGSPVPCIEDIGVDVAWDAVREALRRKSLESRSTSPLEQGRELTVLACR